MQLLLILLNFPRKAFFLPVYAFSSLLFPLGSFSAFPSVCQNDHLITHVVPITPIMVISFYYFFLPHLGTCWGISVPQPGINRSFSLGIPGTLGTNNIVYLINKLKLSNYFASVCVFKQQRYHSEQGNVCGLIRLIVYGKVEVGCKWAAGGVRLWANKQIHMYRWETPCRVLN